jgi:hypothetical protein
MATPLTCISADGRSYGTYMVVMMMMMVVMSFLLALLTYNNKAALMPMQATCQGSILYMCISKLESASFLRSITQLLSEQWDNNLNRGGNTQQEWGNRQLIATATEQGRYASHDKRSKLSFTL